MPTPPCNLLSIRSCGAIVGFCRQMLRFVGSLALLCLAAQAAQAGVVPVCDDLTASDAATLTLTHALARVADCHPEVRTARAALGAAAADVRVAGQAPNPQLTLGAGSISRSVGGGPIWRRTFDQSARIDQLIERGNKPGLRHAAAESTRQAALADLADSARRAAAAVVRAHQDLWAIQGRRSQLQGAVLLSAESLRLLDLRVRAGDAPALDASRFRLDDARLQGDLRQASADAQDQQRQLALLIGAGAVAGHLQPQAVDLAALAAPPQDAPALAALSLELAERRPDVSAALSRVSAASQLRDLAAAARTRDITVGVQLDHWPTSAANLSGTGNTVSLSLSVPLFLRHANEGELARAEADLAMAQDALRRARETASAEIGRAAALTLAAADRRHLVVDQLLPAADKVAAGAELAYRRGASSALELLDARRSQRAVQVERIAADAELAKALADWQVTSSPVDLLLNLGGPRR